MGIMSPRTKYKAAPAKKKVDPLTVALETIEVPRAWIREHGWPDAYDELEAAVIAHEPGFQRHLKPREEFIWHADLVWQSNKESDVAFFRPGAEGQAFLYAQGWRGAA